MRDTTGGDILHIRDILRRDAISRRDALPQADRTAASAQISDTLLGELLSSGTGFVHCYISFRSEVETRRLIQEMIARGLRVVTPIVDRAAGPRALVHTEIKGLENLQRGVFGLDEPIERSPSSLQSLDIVIVPIVAFDRRGSRLGYGKGFYDTFLRELPDTVRRIGLAFAMQEATHIPVLPHDEDVGIVITESEIISCGA